MNDEVKLYSSGTLVSAATVMTGETLAGESVFMYVSNGGVANLTTVAYLTTISTSEITGGRGTAYVLDGGIVNSSIISGGELYVSGGTASHTEVNGYEYKSSDGRYSGEAGGHLYVSAGGVAKENIINSNTRTFIYADGTINSTTMNGGNLYVLSGGLANNTDIYNSGRLTVGYDAELGKYVNGGIANHTVLNDAGVMRVYSGGTANETTLNGGKLFVGASDYEKDGFYIAEFIGGVVNSTMINTGGEVILYGGTANSTTVNAGGNLWVSSGGTANSTTINISGCIHVYSGGTASIAFNPWMMMGRINANDGAVVTYLERDANVYYLDQNMATRKGDVISNVILAACQSAIIYDGGNMTNLVIQNGGTAVVSKGGAVNGFTAAHDMTLTDRIDLEDVTVSGRADLTDYATVRNAQVTDGGKFFLSDGAEAQQTTVTNGSLFVLGRGVAEDITIINGGVYVATGGEVKGDIAISQGGGLYLYGGSIVDGDIHVKGVLYVDETMVSDGHITVELNEASPSLALIQNLDYMSGTDNFTVETGAVGMGYYSLASGASDYSGSVTICEDGVDLGTLSAGETKTFGDTSYTLTNEDGNLGMILGAVVMVTTDGDLDGNGQADIIMTIDQSTHPADGATGAWLIQENQIPTWGNLSQRNAGWSIFGTGWTSAGKTTADVYIKSEDNIVGAWVTNDSGEVTGWETVGSFGSNVQVLGLGDFDGDSKSDLLLRSTDGDGMVGCYLTDGTGWNEFKGLGSEWKICGIGDLNGDGLDDTVLKHDAGFAGSWLTQADGTVAWADLDTLAAGFEIVGCGDFNGDSVDDVLLKKGDYYGAWLVRDGSAYAWMGLGTVTGNVEQIADFNGDGVDDLRVRTSEGDLGALLVNGEDSLDWKYYGSVGEEWNTALAAL